jgi:hypothetical protein
VTPVVTPTNTANLASAASLDLYWIPLGAGTPVVRASGRLYEALRAAIDRRPRADLYHAALIAMVENTPICVEVAPVPDEDGANQRGVVAQGAVGSRLLGRWRVFRYEVRRWRDGTIPDLVHAVQSVRLSTEAATIGTVLDSLATVPVHVWGRDEIGAHDMWNSNSVVSWALSSAGLLDRAGSPPRHGRAPGWQAGIIAATATTRQLAPGVGRSSQSTQSLPSSAT